MKVSIITVTYNSEEFIQDCIDSVRKQDYKDIEHIVIDGNSKDGTISIVKKYSEVKYISEPDNGIYDAINKGIEMSSGKIVGILNSDDFFADNQVVSRIAGEFLKDPTIDGVYADVSFVNRNQQEKVVRHYSSKFFRSWMFKYGFQPAHPTFYAKRVLFDTFGKYRTDLRIAGDFELLMRFFVKMHMKSKYIHDTWVKMRIGGISSSGIGSVVLLNKEILQACRLNEVYSNKLMVYSKYCIKWWGFIFKKKS